PCLLFRARAAPAIVLNSCSARHALPCRAAPSDVSSPGRPGRRRFRAGTLQREGSVKGNQQVLDALNRALTVELTAINQYFCQAKMCQNWGFLKLYHKHYHESLGEMKHAEMLIERTLFPEGTPEIARYDVIRVGTNVKEQFENDLKLEMGGVKLYNEVIALCNQVGDHGTRDLIEPILRE